MIRDPSKIESKKYGLCEEKSGISIQACNYVKNTNKCTMHDDGQITHKSKNKGQLVDIYCNKHNEVITTDDSDLIIKETSERPYKGNIYLGIDSLRHCTDKSFNQNRFKTESTECVTHSTPRSNQDISRPLKPSLKQHASSSSVKDSKKFNVLFSDNIEDDDDSKCLRKTVDHKRENCEKTFKSVERKAKLKHLIGTLTALKEKERKEEQWHDFIKELRTKHGIESDSMIECDPEPPKERIIANEGRNSTSNFHNLIREIYNDDSYPPRMYESKEQKTDKTISYNKNVQCYPTSSQGRLIALQREKEMDERRFKYIDYGWRKKQRYLEQDYKKPEPVNIVIKKPHSRLIFETRSAQTEMKALNLVSEEKEITKETVEETYQRLTQNADRLVNEVIGRNTSRQSSLASIETRLGELIQSLNTLVDEMKSQKHVQKDNKEVEVTEKDIKHKRKLHLHGMRKAEKIVCGLMLDSSATKTDSKSFNHVKHDSTDGSFASFEASAKESSRIVNNEPKCTDSVDVNKQIAVNTEPLSLLGLMRVSADTIKQLLSYMPPISYFYLPLQYPRLKKNSISNYICNICGAAFENPSQLSDHIEGHNLGKARDCCVCRHVLDMRHNKYPGLFRCRYCGKCFTRAYCCNLHEQSCARRLGVKHDVRSSLMILR